MGYIFCIIQFRTTNLQRFGMKKNSQDYTGSTDKAMEENTLRLPTLDQFMELITDEQKSVASSPSGYNVYNKYHKSS